ncbi:MAG: hypothetical protein IME99_09750, partial [Proteobacteria bacterium]|nr:hypothetical protein [Pseudomonadota bacterium]
MSYLKKIGTALLFIALFNIISVTSWHHCSPLFADDQVTSTLNQELLNEKLTEEITQLRIDNNSWNYPALGTFVTALVAIIGVFVTLSKLANDRRLEQERRKDEHDQGVAERHQERERRRAEDNQRFEDNRLARMQREKEDLRWAEESRLAREQREADS